MGELNIPKVDFPIPDFKSFANRDITDNLLRQRGFDQLFKTSYGKGTSNEELMLEHGFVEIYDCGQASYSWYR